jgi:hypothetical protein
MKENGSNNIKLTLDMLRFLHYLEKFTKFDFDQNYHYVYGNTCVHLSA